MLILEKTKYSKMYSEQLKKYYLKLFKTNSKFFKISSKAERKKTIYSELEEFVKKFFISKDKGKTLEGLTKENIINIVGNIIVPGYMLKSRDTYVIRRE